MFQQHSFGYWLRLKRKALDLTQAALADQVGCSAATIRKIEAEERRPSAQIISRLAQIFNIPKDEQAAFLRFGRGEWQAAPHSPEVKAPWRELTGLHPTNLPALTTSFIGREDDIEKITGYFSHADIRLVSLYGPPGIGKTRLSHEVARRMLPEMTDGVFFVGLASLDEPFLIAPTIIQSLGFMETEDLPVMKDLETGIGAKRMLLILDNCEHLIEEVALLVSELLLSCSRLKILVTSREALRVPGEWLYAVPALEIPIAAAQINMEIALKSPAVKLFAERARAVRSDFQLNADNIQAVASICTQLDGLPLAIELIAARIRLMSAQSLLDKLTELYVLSADGMRAVSARQKTLRNAISWSYNLLAPEEQRIFTCLAVFSGSFTLEAAESIFSTFVSGKPISDLVEALSDKGLLQRSFEAHGEVRFHMLVTIQHFAMSCLRNMDMDAIARNRHLDYYLSLAERGDQEMRGPQQAEWGYRFETEHDNLRAALEWSQINQDTRSVLKLLCALSWSWEVHGRYTEAYRWFEKTCNLPKLSKYPALYSKLLNHIGRLYWTQEKYPEARAVLEESQSISSKLASDGEPLLAETLNWLGMVALMGENDSHKAFTALEQGLALYIKLGNEQGVALSRFHLGIVESDLNRYEEAMQHYEHSLAMFRKFGDLFFIARVSMFLGYEHLKTGNPDLARSLFEEHLRIDQELQFWDGIADGWRDLGNLARYQRKYNQAEAFYEQSLAVSTDHGLHFSETIYNLGLVALQQNNYEAAYQRFFQLIELVQKQENKARAGFYLTGLAVAAGGINQAERAVKLSMAAQSILESSGNIFPPGEFKEFDHLIRKAHMQFNEIELASIKAVGQAMSMEQAIAYVLQID